MPVIDTPNTTSVALSAQPWLPTPSPQLRLSTPTLDPLPVGAADWSQALAANPGLYASSNLPTGLTPRFSPTFPQLQSPGVSAEIAANPTDPPPPSQSLSDLFRCTEYPFTSAAPPKPVSNVSRSQPQKHDLPVSQPVASAALHDLKASAPLAAAYRTPAEVVPQNMPQTLPQTLPQTQAAFSQPIASFPLGRPDNIPSLPPRPAAVVPTAAATVPAVATPIAPVPDLAKAALTVGGQRAVLGSGIVSNAVQEAQVRARMKAESFARARKRKRSEHPTEADRAMEKINEEESKLSPEQLKRKRYERRLALNRESAAVSRVRRREYVKLLEEQLVNAEKERVRLATELSDMQKQHNKLKDHLRKLEGEI